MENNSFTNHIIFRFFGKVGDLAVLSLLWVLCCLPVITIGPACAALYHTVLKSVRRERGMMLEEYGSFFRANLKQGCKITLICLAYAGFIWLAFWGADRMSMQAGMYEFFFFATRMTLMPAILLLPWLFAVLARFQLTVTNTFRVAFYTAVRHLPMTILMAVLLFGCVIFLYFFSPFLVVVPGIYCWVSTYLIERGFARYDPQQPGNETK